MAEVNPVSTTPAQRGSLRISSKIAEAGKSFRRGLGSVVSATTDTISRTRAKIAARQKSINAENKRQADIERKNKEIVRRKSRENDIESASLVRPVKSLVQRVVAKPLKSFWNLLAAWAVANLPALVKKIRVFVKKVRIAGAAIKRAFSAIGPFFSSLWGIAQAFIQNIKEFDFNDKSGRLKKARAEMDDNMEEIRLSVEEVGNVWGREEAELDKMLLQFEEGKTMTETLNALLPPEAQITIEGDPGQEDVETVQPQTPALSTSSGSNVAGAGMGKNLQALLQTISFAEGTSGADGYNKWFGGRTDMDLSQMTINEVGAEMDRRNRTGENKYGKYASSAVGKYQMMNPEAAAVAAGLDPAVDKFTPENQDKMVIAYYLKGQAKLTDAELNGPLTPEIIDKLAPVFASFPNLFGPDNKGRVGTNTSFYGQGGKSKDAILEYYGKVKKLNAAAQTTSPTQSAKPNLIERAQTAIGSLFNFGSQNNQEQPQAPAAQTAQPMQAATPAAPSGATPPAQTTTPQRTVEPRSEVTFIEKTKQITSQIFGLGEQADTAAQSATTPEQRQEYVEEESSKNISTGTGNTYIDGLVRSVIPGFGLPQSEQPPAAQTTQPQQAGDTNNQTIWQRIDNYAEQYLQNIRQIKTDWTTPSGDAPRAPDGAIAPVTPTNSPVGNSNYILVDKVAYADLSRTSAEGGRGAVGKTSGYGPRQSPGGIGSTNHRGVDIGTSGQYGYGVSCAIRGRVVYVGVQGGAGLMVSIISGNKEYKFMHLNQAYVRKGPYNGEVIGEIGNTGASTDVHLHYEVLVNGTHVNPMPYLKLLEVGKIKTVSRSSQSISPVASARAEETAQQVASIRTNWGSGGAPGSEKVLIIKETDVIQVA